MVTKATRKRMALLRKRAMDIWRSYGERYRNLIPDYEKSYERVKALQKEKRGKETVKVHRVKKSLIRDLPEIEFLQIAEEAVARNYIDKLAESGLCAIIANVDVMINYCPAWVSLIGATFDNNYTCERYGRRSPCGKDPEYGMH